MAKLAKAAAAASVLVAIAGCSDARRAAEDEATPPPPAGAAVDPQVSRLDLPDRASYQLHHWTFALDRTELEIHDDGLGRDPERALRRAGASLSINAGFFSLGGHAEGLSVSKGRELAPFWLGLGGGVLTVDGHRAVLHDADRWPSPRGIDFAIQCRPRLVVAGAVNIRRDTGQRADRTALCIRDAGRTLDVYLARTDSPSGLGGPTLFALAQKLVEEGCEEALNLDGGPSTSAAWREPGETAVRLLPPRGPVRQWITFRVRP
jgi:hypothetical protein